MSFEAATPAVPGVRLWAIKYQLNIQQERFVLSYAQHFDPRRAAMDAGFTPQNAKSIATKYLDLVKVQRAIKAHVFELKNTTEEYRDALIAEFFGIATSNVMDVLDEGYRLKPIAEWPRVWSSGSAGRVSAQYAPGDTSGVPVTVTVVGSKKMWALDKLFGYFGLDGRPGYQRVDTEALEKTHEEFRKKWF